MFKKIFSFGLSLSIFSAMTPWAWAGDIMEQIQETGVIRAGYRSDTVPFAFVDDDGKPVGYAIELLELIREETETRLGKPVELEFIEITPNNRFEQITDGIIDIECGSTTITWERNNYVDFSASYFASGTQMIVNKGSNWANAQSLAGAKIAVIPNTTNETAIREFAPDAEFIFVESEEEGWKMVQEDKVVGFAGDGILLQALKAQVTDSDSYEIVPEFPYMIESYACTLPQNESEWRNVVNYSLVKYMQGVVVGVPEYQNLYSRWFGVNGVTPYPIETMADYFQGIVNGYEWIRIEGRY
ncbi:amino acid ABC transporter substrate-binding protein [Cyanobacterium stanieri LEGE 03274]|uniref:Amino acid ABC transporter substrate-binding protein n=1 Tax=Cyanobacterium stanieri LEGE 03274 TaxID=1828756 RepID=A0ABR9V7F8_9CHRO|nr:amino acid ABC transporter substrate-binding protein [Cyanobacterium stanieri]MBE9223802.1 amino acid ABC transporter substrate-binding protein [Cyanobacterium stanieri LEGE 03274]